MRKETPETRLWQAFESKIDNQEYPLSEEDAFTYIKHRPVELSLALTALLKSLKSPIDALYAAHKAQCTDARGVAILENKILMMFETDLSGEVLITETGVSSRLSLNDCWITELSTGFDRAELESMEPLTLTEIIRRHIAIMIGDAFEINALIVSKRNQFRNIGKLNRSEQ